MASGEWRVASGCKDLSYSFSFKRAFIAFYTEDFLFAIRHSPLKKEGRAFARPSVFCFTQVNYFTFVESSAPALKRTTFLALI